MNLSTLLSSRASTGRPVRAALIGAGKFGSMILSQIPRIGGLRMAVVVDLDIGQARQSSSVSAELTVDTTPAARVKRLKTARLPHIAAMLACQGDRVCH
jgi:predicted homoserine dehydrogenase-like protein